MNPAGSALVSRIEANRTYLSVSWSSSSPSGRHIQRSLPRAKAFDPKTEGTDKVSSIFQVPGEQRLADGEERAKESATSY